MFQYFHPHRIGFDVAFALILLVTTVWNVSTKHTLMRIVNEIWSKVSIFCIGHSSKWRFTWTNIFSWIKKKFEIRHYYWPILLATNWIWPFIFTWAKRPFEALFIRIFFLLFCRCREKCQFRSKRVDRRTQNERNENTSKCKFDKSSAQKLEKRPMKAPNVLRSK